VSSGAPESPGKGKERPDLQEVLPGKDPADDHRRRRGMDFLTGAAYWGIAVLVIVNALIVIKMKVDVGEEAGSGKDSSKCQSGI